MSKHIFWISSYPKSGNTLVRAIISALFFSRNGKFQLDQLKHTGQFERRDRLNLIKKINKEEFFNLDQLKILSKYWLTLQNKENMKIKKGFGFMKSHSSYVSIFNNWFTNLNNTAGYIYIVRDPRDVAISWSKHANLNYDDSISFMLNFNSCIEWAQTNSELPDNIKPKTFLSSWDEHVLSWTKNDLDVPKLLLKYEDLVYKKEEIVKIIVKFFEKNFSIKFNSNDEKIANIVESTSFEKLKSQESKYGFAEASSGTFFRKGEKNQWKNELNVQQIVRLENKFEDFINKFGYD
jgi:hypothetical protein